jgi:DNA polymerase-3 subunit alpha
MVQRVDIHNHTRYSNLRLRDALATPEQLIDKAIELGLAGISISDHEAVSGHIKANQYAQKIKEEHPDFKVMLGDEIYLVDSRPSDEHYHYVLTAIDEVGYHQIKEISSIAWLHSYAAKGLTRVDTLKSDLERIVMKNPGHLIGSTACIGSELGQSILKLTKAEKSNDAAAAKVYHDKIVNYILWNKKVFGDNFYIEAQPGVSKEQITVNQRILSIAQCFGVKMIPTSDTHYLRPEDRYVHKSFLNSENKEREVDSFYQDAYLHTNEEMIEKFALSNFDKLFVEQMFANSMEIYDKVKDFSLFHPQAVPQVAVDFFPIQKAPADLANYSTLAKMYESEDKIDRYWINTCINRLRAINKFNEIYLNELEEEAEVKTIIGQKLNTNMFAYPVCLAHYIEMIWDTGSSVGVGRGSACSALNHYLLGITQLDPIEWNFPFFRYMNRDTENLGDIDIDVCPSKVQEIVKNIGAERSKDFNDSVEDEEVRRSLGAVYVCTFGTESTKSAILTACRGYRSEDFPNGIDVDVAQYMSSLVPVERGFTWSLKDMIEGNPDKDRKPVAAFINEVNQYPGLLEVIQGIEGCISRRGRHASGVLFNGEDPFEFNAYMKTPSGEVVTQYDLHDAEWAGSVKMDILVTEVQDKIVKTIYFLQEHGEIEKNLTLKEAYDKYLHPDVLPLKDEKTWAVIQQAASLDLFQLDSDIGRQGAKKVSPTTMQELSATNGLIRLMAAEKGAETPMETYLRFRANPKSWVKTMDQYGLTDLERVALNRYVGETYGIGISQEQLMRTLMDEDICGFSLKEANKARKVVSKKQMNKIAELKEQVFEKAKSHGLAQYVWDFVVGTQLGYAFSEIHSMSYSFIGFQTAYLATNWNPIFWNTACLVVNSGSLDEDSEEGTDYAKVAKAIGNIKSKGISVSTVDINKSNYSFEPDVENNTILYGLKSLNKVGTEAVAEIVSARPYTGIGDFMTRCPQKKPVMISLIKAGAFDSLDEHWARQICSSSPRRAIMAWYIYHTSDLKNKLTLQNFNALIQNNIIPDELSFQKRTFVFNKYLKDNTKWTKYYMFNDSCMKFYNSFFDPDQLEAVNGVPCILQTKWDKIYKGVMDGARDWLKENQLVALEQLNGQILKENWNKYASGTISAWEMESMCFYAHPHELAEVDMNKYGIKNFFKMSAEPEVDYFFKRNGHEIPVYKTTKIIGTVLSKNDTRSSVSILTTTGVVNVKFTKEYYAKYNRQLSEVQEDGTKKRIETGWFTRGTIIMVTGYRVDDTFRAKTYSKTTTHQLYKAAVAANGKDLQLEHERANEEAVA